MKNLSILIFMTLFFVSGLVAQERYLEEITDSVLVETFTYSQKDTVALQMDVYTPAFDNETNRPVYLYVHGGGFSGGTRDGMGTQIFCKKLARRGFVAISMSYRLTRKNTKTAFGCDCPTFEKLKTFEAAGEDLRDATHFIIQQHENFGIDPQKIILSGSSAGAEAVLYVAYDAPYCYGLNSGPVAYAGVVAMAGAIPDISHIYDESAIPSMFFHGTCDNLVPYGNAPHHYCNEDKAGYLILNGSYTIAEKLRELGKPYWLHTTCGGNHNLAGTPMTQYFDEILTFCHDFVLNGEKDQIHTIIPGKHNCDYPSYNFCTD